MAANDWAVLRYVHIDIAIVKSTSLMTSLKEMAGCVIVVIAASSDPP